LPPWGAVLSIHLPYRLKEKEVTVPVAPLLKPGESYRLLNPTDYYGEPVSRGRCEGETIVVPMENEFGAFVVLKQ